MQLDWLYQLKKRMLLGILGIMTVTLAATMVFLAIYLRSSLLTDSRIKTQALGTVIKSSLSSLMIARNPDLIQDVIEKVGSANNTVTKAFIIDRNGRIAYSSDKAEIGRVLDRTKEATCLGCHQRPGIPPHEDTLVLENNGLRIQRNVKVFYNERSCYGCHPETDRINGKLIIDRSLEKTYSLITAVELIILASGLVCLVFLVPFFSLFLSRNINKYIEKIVRQSSELAVLYHMMERLSRTIDLDELIGIVVEIVGDTFGADEVDVVFTKEGREYRCIGWTRQENKKIRKKIAAGDPLLPIIDQWLKDSLTEEKISEDRRQVIIPVAKEGKRLALIVVRRNGPFDPERLSLTKAVSSHLTVAFENAFLHYIAITDELTKLYTQRHFRQCIEKEFENFEKYGEKFTLLMLDLDKFKAINDTFGHMAGDAVLKETAYHIMQAIRDNDLAFRYGGEEFTLLLPSSDAAAGRHVAERIRQSIESARFDPGSGGISATISIGVATCPDNARSISDLKLTADRALYRAKEGGRNRVVVSDESPA
ncbi:MAG: sensor domain-containing diguanylate cyclase [Nitrospirae bacterium]|nr:MAG: sensor domain-containing diguanylate cyclase [Nitrospirota bacterium]